MRAQRFSAGGGRVKDGVSPDELVASVVLFGTLAEMVDGFSHVSAACLHDA